MPSRTTGVTATGVYRPYLGGNINMWRGKTAAQAWADALTSLER